MPAHFLPCAENEATRVWSFLEKEGSLWYWKGHKHLARLASGKISDFYADLSPLFTKCEMQNRVGHGLWMGLIRQTDSQSKGLFDWYGSWFVGSAYGGIWLAMALQRSCTMNTRAAFTEKIVAGAVAASAPRVEAMSLKRFDLGPSPYVTLVEDVLTTGSTLRKSVDAILEKHPDVTFHPAVAVAINRSGSSVFSCSDGRRFDVVALIDVPARTWDSEQDLPDEMKSCVPIKPKGNWKALTEEML